MPCCGGAYGYCGGCPHFDPELTGRCYHCGATLPDHDADCRLADDDSTDEGATT